MNIPKHFPPKNPLKMWSFFLFGNVFGRTHVREHKSTGGDMLFESYTLYIRAEMINWPQVRVLELISGFGGKRVHID